MKNLKLLLIPLVFLVLTSFVSAGVNIQAFFDSTNGNTYTMYDGQQEGITVVTGPEGEMETTIRIDVDLLDANTGAQITNLIYTATGVQFYDGYRIITQADYLVPGNYLIRANVRGSSGASDTANLYLNVLPSICPGNPPVITIIGANPVNINQGDIYTDAGATAMDPEEGDLTADILTNGLPINTNVLGTYFVTYTVTDFCGNIGQAMRRINVVNPGTGGDTTPPVIIINDPTNSTYTIPPTEIDFTVTDANPTTCWYSLDGGSTLISTSCTMAVTGLNPVQGTNIWMIIARDTSGNQASESVTFTLNSSGTGDDTTAPLITIINPENKEYDDSEILFEILTNEPCTEAWFNLGGANITMDNHNNLAFDYIRDLSDGDYEVTFYARDAAGNIGTASIEFSVDDDESNGSSDDDDDDDWKNKYLTGVQDTSIGTGGAISMIYLGDNAKKNKWALSLEGLTKWLLWLILLLLIAILITWSAKRYSEY